jgi:large subunit ribosomal protein L22
MEAVAKLRKSPISPRKMRLVADLIRGVQANQALAILKNEPKQCAVYLEKLLLAAMASWQSKNQDVSLETAGLYIKTIHVDSAGMLKRLMPAPQGRGHRIRKRFNHVTLIVDRFVAREKPAKNTEPTAENLPREKSVKNTERTTKAQPKKQAKITNGTKS